MQRTIRSYISDVRVALKLISSDDIASDRYIASELQKQSVKLVHQQLQKRVGWNDPNLFTPLNCIPMEDVDLVECCDYKGDCKVSKSTITIPQIVSANNSLVIQGVWSIDKKQRFKEINPNRYANWLNMKYKNKEDKFFWIQNEHIYCSDPSIERLSLSAFFLDSINPHTYSCESSKNDCSTNPLDLELKTIPKLAEDIVTLTYKKLMETYQRVKEDKTEDDTSNK